MPTEPSLPPELYGSRAGLRFPEATVRLVVVQERADAWHAFADDVLAEVQRPFPGRGAKGHAEVGAERRVPWNRLDGFSHS